MSRGREWMTIAMVLCTLVFIGGCGVCWYSCVELIGAEGSGIGAWGMLGFGLFIIIDSMVLARGVRLALGRMG